LAANGSILAAALLSDRPIHDLPMKVAACVVAMSYFTYVAYIVIRRVQLQENAV
jgi:hypothetical protein